MTGSTFALDPRLASDTVLLTRTPTSQLLLMDDVRWPWVILVPRVPGATEMHALAPAVRIALRLEIDLAAEALQAATHCLSLNVAALGNRVSQLHVHVVARDVGDPNWPNPVWGYGRTERRVQGEIPHFATQVQGALTEMCTSSDVGSE